MANPIDGSGQTVTAWTLGRDRHAVTCVLMAVASGGYVLQLSHEGQRVLDAPCASPQEAIARSVEAFEVFVACGWFAPQRITK